MFESADENEQHYERAQYTFVQCIAGADSELDAAGEWITKYAEKFSGRIITNFDEQRPMLSNAPLSYQKLVARTYDKAVFNHYSWEIKSARIDKVIQKSVVQLGDMHVSNNINVGGPAIINIDSVLKGVTQTIGRAPGLDKGQKIELEELVNTLNSIASRTRLSATSFGGMGSRRTETKPEHDLEGFHRGPHGGARRHGLLHCGSADMARSGNLLLAVLYQLRISAGQLSRSNSASYGRMDAADGPECD